MIQVASIIDGATRPVHPAPPAIQHLFTPVFHAPSTFMGYPDVTSFLQAWLPIVFMGVLVIGVFALMRFMPRTRPAEIKPDSAPPIALGRHRRRRGGQGGAARGRRLPARPRALPRSRREGAEGHPAPRAAGHRQDAAGQGRRARVGRHLLRPVGGLVRRDVRRRRRRPDPPPVQIRAQEGARDRVHRRARRGRRPPRLRRLAASATRRSTSCWSRWTASRRARTSS